MNTLPTTNQPFHLITHINYVGTLNEWIQRHGRNLKLNESYDYDGPEHIRHWTCTITISGVEDVKIIGQGGTKKVAKNAWVHFSSDFQPVSVLKKRENLTEPLTRLAKLSHSSLVCPRYRDPLFHPLIFYRRRTMLSHWISTSYNLARMLSSSSILFM